MSDDVCATCGKVRDYAWHREAWSGDFVPADAHAFRSSSHCPKWCDSDPETDPHEHSCSVVGCEAVTEIDATECKEHQEYADAMVRWAEAMEGV